MISRNCTRPTLSKANWSDRKRVVSNRKR